MLADVVLTLHVAIATFITLGLPAIWLGWALGWRWIRNPWFRYGHLAAILCVAAEALVGVKCPLTILEDALRGLTEPRSFIGRWMARLLFYQAPDWVFTVVYTTFALATFATFVFIRPSARSAAQRPRDMIRPSGP